MGNFLAGKVVAVTGAGRGIGRAVALAAAAQGARVVVNDYGVSIEGGAPSSEVAESVVKEIEAAGGEAVAVADDISTMAGGQRIVDTALAQYGRIDGVVCVAGILRERMLFNMSEEEWDPVVATHLKGTFTVFRAASAVMRKQGSGTLIGLHQRQPPGVGVPGQLQRREGRDHLAGAERRAGAAQVRGDGQRGRARRADPDVGERADGAEGDRRAGGRGGAGRLSAAASGPGGEITGQVYTVAGPKIAVWAQPRELRAGYADGGGWTPERIAEFLPGSVGADPMPMLAQLEAMARAARRRGAARRRRWLVAQFAAPRSRSGDRY